MKTNKTDSKESKPRITLFNNNCLTNDPCAICGERCDPDGLDYVLYGSSALVCDACALEYAPEIVISKKAAVNYIHPFMADEAPGHCPKLPLKQQWAEAF